MENAVKLTYKDIYTELEKLHYPDLSTLNACIRSELEKHNNQTLTSRKYSPRDYYEDMERDTLAPLHPVRYQIKKRVMATVDKYGCVRLREDVHHYSVPYTLIGKKLKLSYNSTEVEIYDGYERVALHPREGKPYGYTILAEHLCPRHRALIDFSPEKYIEQAATLGEDVLRYIRKILEVKKYPEQANKTCTGVLNLAHKAGTDRLAFACRLAHSYGRYGFLELQDILNSSQAQIELPEETAPIPEHENIRGIAYYK